jgi:hypothetical protein
MPDFAYDRVRAGLPMPGVVIIRDDHEVVTRNPIGIRDLHAAIPTAMGISPKVSFDVEKRPFYATEDGKGMPVTDLFARG